MYTEKIINLFKNPKNSGLIKSADGVGEVTNKLTGDLVRFYLKVEEGQITNAKFKAFGCVGLIAMCEVATELLKDKTIEEALKITNKNILDAIGALPEDKIKYSVILQQTIQNAVEDYRKKQIKLALKQATK